SSALRCALRCHSRRREMYAWCCSGEEMVFGASSLTRYLAGSRSAVAGTFPPSFVVLFVGQHGQYRNRSHFVVYVGYQPGFVVLDIEHYAVPNRVGILARPPDSGQVAPGRLHSLHDPDPRTKRAFPVRMLLLRSFYQMFADNLHWESYQIAKSLVKKIP